MKLLRLWCQAFAVVALVSAAPWVHAAPTTSFTLTSSPTSYAGAGQSMTLTESEFNTFHISNSGFDFIHALIWFQPVGDAWSMGFAPPEGQVLAVGRYDNAGWGRNEALSLLTFGGQGRATSGDGWFEVVDLAYDADGSVKRFGVNFETHDNYVASAWNYGQLRFNSEVPLSPRPMAPVPEPSTCATILLGALLIWAARGRRGKTRGHLDVSPRCHVAGPWKR